MSSNQRATARSLAAGLLLSLTATSLVRAQQSPRVDLGGSIAVGGEEERYLRALQIAGVAPLTSWAIQPFSPVQASMLRGARQHPWQTRYDTLPIRAPIRFLRPGVGVAENTAFPYQLSNGPVWTGRGITLQGQLGAAASWKSLYAQFAPLGFVAQNAPFALAPNGLSGAGQYADPRYPGNIDLPQRFGKSTYRRLDVGESMIALDTHGAFLGVSSMAQRWGPARDFPLVLGPNPGGFPNVFLGTSTPLDLWLFRLHGRVIYGRLGQSSRFPAVDSTRERLGSGLVLSLLPRGVPGLELGAARFIHRPWTSDAVSWTSLRRPFSGVISDNRADNTLNNPLENQTGSVFARWAVPSAKLEVYTEFYKEDYPGGFHVAGQSLIEMPDDYSSFTVGLQRAFNPNPSKLLVLHTEVVNGEISHQGRGDGPYDHPLPPYIHSEELQGHTVNGMLLGSPDAYGGSGWRIGIDEFTSSGRRSVSLERTLRLDWLPTLAASQSLVQPDVLFALRIELLRFARSADYGVTIVPAVDLNRNLVARRDVFNLAVGLTSHGW